MSKNGVTFKDAVASRRILLKRIGILKQNSGFASKDRSFHTSHNMDMQSKVFKRPLDLTLQSAGNGTIPMYSLALNSSYQALSETILNSWKKSLPLWMMEMMNTDGGGALDSFACSDMEKNVAGATRDEKSTDQDHTEGTISNKEMIIPSEVHGLCNEQEQEVETVQEPVVALLNELEMKAKTFRRWSLKLSVSGYFHVFGYNYRKVKHVSRNITSRNITSSWERVDAHTMRSSDGTVYRLLGLPEFSARVPVFVQDSFKAGFPPNWLQIKAKWLQFLEQGRPSDFNWAENNKAAQVTQNCYVQISPLRLSPEVAVNMVQRRLERWTPILVAPKSLKIKGFLSSTHLEHTTAAVKNILGGNMFECEDGAEYQLIGPFTDPHKSIPTTIQKYLCKGLPQKWKKFVDQWVDLQRCQYPETDKYEGKNLAQKHNSALVLTDVQEEIEIQRTLEKWTPILVIPESLKIRGFLSSTKLWHTTALLKKVQEDKIECEDGAEYKLIGPFTDPFKKIPNEIQQYLQKGMPCKWKQMAAKWTALQTTSSEDKKCEVPENMMLKPLEEATLRSKRGRIRIPPLKFWLGEKMVRDCNTTMVLTCTEENSEEPQKSTLEVQCRRANRNFNKHHKLKRKVETQQEKQDDQVKRKNKKIKQSVSSKVQKQVNQHIRKSMKNKQFESEKEKEEEDDDPSVKMNRWFAEIRDAEEDVLPGGYVDNSNSIDYDEHIRNLVANRSAMSSCPQSPIHNYMAREETVVSSLVCSPSPMPEFSSKWISQYIERERKIQKTRQPMEHLGNKNKKKIYTEPQMGKYKNPQYEEIADSWSSDSDLSSTYDND